MGIRSAVAALFALSILAPTHAGADDTRHAYRIEARLDAERHLVSGTARIVWTNESEAAASELWLHLYMNAFENRETVFMRESRGQLRGVTFLSPGSIRLSALRIAGEDHLRTADDEVIARDRTQLRVPLLAPVPPGASIELEVSFETALPTAFARAGYVDDFHMVAQWFPKLARLERDGQWATFPYHGLGEFYADFALYDVTLDLPSEHVVGATGVEVETVRHGDRTTHRFVAERVHDFAFASDPDFKIRVQDCSGTKVRVLAPPGFDRTALRSLRITCEGLEYLGRLYGPYPYPALTVVVPPRGASGAAGMEYPTLFTTDGGHFTIPFLHSGGVDDT
ncbi:MAG: M1 family metallopeptidase, partial [Polyangiaceae bacterium]|nr:M1 family metallopeptidase [Polyangiaceae bacterium]